MDRYFLGLAYQLALENEGNTAPNPTVGAVVAREREIIGWGFHERAGAPHAEIVALKNAGEAARGATLYCSLEPCAHYGKTPPCSDAIKAAGISRVVYGAIDRNPLVIGKGDRVLREAGIHVEQLTLPQFAEFYEPLFQTFSKKHPYVILKAAMTANGIIAPADRNSRWITNETSRQWVHQLRAQCDAILVGANTVRTDRPRLTVRVPAIKRKPLRVILDSEFKIDPADCSLLEDDGLILICGVQDAPEGYEQAWRNHGAETVRIKDVPDLLEHLFIRGVRKLLIEGGQKIFTFFHSANLIDEYILMIAPRLLTGKNFLNLFAGEEQSLSQTGRLQLEFAQPLDGDVILRMKRLRKDAYRESTNV